MSVITITASRGLDGTVTIPIEADLSGGDNFVVLDLTGARAEFIVCGRSIDTDGDFAEIVSNTVVLKPGALDLTAGIYRTAKLVVYNETWPAGIEVAGPGKDTEIELDYRN
jgi:hypothetical protein